MTNMTTNLNKLLLRPREAAQMLAVSERTLWSLTAAGQIPHVRLRRSVRYPIDDIRAWIHEQKIGGKK